MATRIIPAFALLLASSIHAQVGGGPQPRVQIDHEIRQAVLERLAETIEAEYVVADVAAALSREFRAAAAEDRYSDEQFSGRFAQRVTQDLLEISGDKHLRLVQRSPRKPGAPAAGRPGPDPSYGFAQVRRLSGGVGYLDLHEFLPREEAYYRAEEVMQSLADSDALIIDLRRNSGGGPGMVAFLAGYFFEEPALLNRHHNRAANETTELWSKRPPSGALFADTPLYLLTSPRTFSAGEAFAYALQARDRAVVVGEATGGGAHPTRDVRVHEHFVVLMPVAQAINPVTGENWEGEGVKPDIEARAQDALEAAHVLALEKAAARSGSSAALGAALEKARADLDAARAKPTEEQRPNRGRVVVRRR